MRSVADRNVVMRRMNVYVVEQLTFAVPGTGLKMDTALILRDRDYLPNSFHLARLKIC